MDKKVLNAIVGVGIGVGGMIFGSLLQSYRNMKNTPDAVIAKMEAEKVAAKAAKEEANAAKADNEKALSELRATKEQYQNEVRKELEPKIRKELETYIEKADSTYEKAKQERAVAEAKLETIKYMTKNMENSNVKTLGGFNIWASE